MSLQARIKAIERACRRLDRQAQAEAAGRIEYIVSEKFLPNTEGAEYGPDHVYKDLIFTVSGSRGNE